MTGSIHHQNLPECVHPDPPNMYPCHPALVELMIDSETFEYCDFHAKEALGDEATIPHIERIVIISENGRRRSWEKNGRPDVERAWGYAARAYVDYGCCLPGGIDPALLNKLPEEVA